jgi:membrane protein YdbS with pleckstrin-like domain
MTTPPGAAGPSDPDGPRDRPTEPIPPRRGEPRDDDGPDYSDDAAYSGGPGYSDNAAYSDGPSYATSDGPGYATEETRIRGTARVGATRTFVRPEFTEEELEGLAGGGTTMAPRRVLPLEDEPSSLVARYLFPTERYRGEWKRHWIHLTVPLLVGIGTTFVLGYLSGFLAQQDVAEMAVVSIALWVAVMGWVAWKIGDWFFDRFILTNKRVMVVNGIITRRVAMMPLLRVTDMKYEQSPLGRILNYGTFVLESAGQEQALREVKHLPNPNELYLRVVEEMYEPQAVEARLSSTKSSEEEADDGS